ncbi:hypothetical protein QUF54_09885, partial [Candidatus Marithioploca araucensis]|nr:hypothetical protein [Candidatus Marithioploca araucensis]
MKNMRYLIGMACVTSLVFGMSAYAKPGNGNGNGNGNNDSGSSSTGSSSTTDEGSVSDSVTVYVNDKKNSTYKITLESNEGNSWSYKVEQIEGRDLSHWDLALGSCLEYVRVTDDGEKKPNGDPSNADPGEGADKSVKGSPLIKWDTQGGTFTITLDANYRKGTVSVLAKTGTMYGTGKITGPDCSLQEVEVCDYIYAVHDKGLNDSQIVRYKDGVIEPLGPSRDGYDIEGIDITLNGVMYGAASDHGNDPGMLYQINMLNGDFIEEEETDCSGLDGISVNPSTNELWGWSQTDGLVKVQESGCPTVIAPPANIEVEDLSWDNAGEVLYFPYNVGSNPDSNDAPKPHFLGKYVPGTGVELEICEFQAPEIEALEVNEEGHLLVGYHDHGTQLVTVIDPETCEVSGGIE